MHLFGGVGIPGFDGHGHFDPLFVGIAEICKVLRSGSHVVVDVVGRVA